MDHCISAFSEKKKDELYRIYITDALKVIGHLDRRYADLVDFDRKVETRTSEEIIRDIKGKLGRIGGENK